MFFHLTATLIDWKFWLVALIVFIVIEAASVSLLSIWFMVGSLIALVLDLVGVSEIWQIIAFFVSSIICLIIFLIVIKPRLNCKQSKIEKTNADRIIGKEGIVLQRISPLENLGQIRVQGQIWSASSYHDIEIPEQTLVIVQEIRGVKALVVPKN